MEYRTDEPMRVEVQSYEGNCTADGLSKFSNLTLPASTEGIKEVFIPFHKFPKINLRRVGVRISYYSYLCVSVITLMIINVRMRIDCLLPYLRAAMHPHIYIDLACYRKAVLERKNWIIPSMSLILIPLRSKFDKLMIPAAITGTLIGKNPIMKWVTYFSVLYLFCT
jgi:hypothetical protein